MTQQVQVNSRRRLAAAASSVVVHLFLLAIMAAVGLGALVTEDRFPPASLEEEEDEKITFEQLTSLVSGGSFTAPVALPTPVPQLQQGSSTPAAPKPVETPAPTQPAEEFKPDVRFHTSATTPEHGDGGNAESTAAPSDPTVNTLGLEGYSIQSFSRPRATGSGIITVKVTVDPQGSVISAEYAGTRSYGSVIENRQARERCCRTALASKFSVPAGTVDNRTGYIQYRF